MQFSLYMILSNIWAFQQPGAPSQSLSMKKSLLHRQLEDRWARKCINIMPIVLSKFLSWKMCLELNQIKDVLHSIQLSKAGFSIINGFRTTNSLTCYWLLESNYFEEIVTRSLGEKAHYERVFPVHLSHITILVHPAVAESIYEAPSKAMLSVLLQNYFETEMMKCLSSIYFCCLKNISQAGLPRYAKEVDPVRKNLQEQDFRVGTSCTQP